MHHFDQNAAGVSGMMGGPPAGRFELKGGFRVRGEGMFHRVVCFPVINPLGYNPIDYTPLGYKSKWTLRKPRDDDINGIKCPVKRRRS